MALRNLRSSPEYKDLASLIRAYGFGRRLFYAPNIGNWGDALIHFGTLQFLQYFDIAVQQLHRNVFFNIRSALAPTGMRLPGAVLLAGGGGAWCSNYADSRQFLAHCGMLFDHVIVLPTSYELPQLDLHPDQISYFRRDHFASAAVVHKSQFCHDMAFFLDLDVSAVPSSQQVGNFFRTDRERNSASSIPPDNLDISLHGTDETHPLSFFETLARHGMTRTDRMHVAIASCLLGIQCDLYPGNYSKSADLFHSTIAANYPTCRLLSWQ
jgi:exopolysaccharide biosynthesis predicted pyruvyltransferase EpsI